MRTYPVRAAVAVTLYLCLSPGPASATVADDLCAPVADPCIVSTPVVVDADSVLDFGIRTLRIDDTGSLTWSSTLQIIAGTCDFAKASKLIEAKTSPGNGLLQLDCGSSTLAGSMTTVGAGIVVAGDGPHVFSGKIKVQGDFVGVIAIESQGLPGDITISGQIKAKAKIGPPPGEFRVVSNSGNVAVTDKGKIKLQGVAAGDANEFVLFGAAIGSLTFDGKIDARAKDGAYHFNFEADGNVTLGPKSQVTAKAKGRGAEIAINSQSASVTMRGKIQAAAKLADPDGGRVHVCAGDDILIDGKASVDTSSGSSGSIIVGAFDVAQVGTALAGAKLTSKTGGDIEVCGGTSATISSTTKVEPAPTAVGLTGDCLSPSSQVFFLLDCAVD